MSDPVSAPSLLRALVLDCQRELARYLKPDSGIGEREVIDRLFARLDGPQARGALTQEETMEAENARLRAALNAVGWECDPDDAEWSDPAAVRQWMWGLVTKTIGTPIAPPSIA